MFRAKLLVVDDELFFLRGMHTGLELLEYTVFSAPSAIEALRLLDTYRIDILITDLRMPGMDGLELVETAKKKFKQLRCIVISGHGDMLDSIKALNLGVSYYVVKPPNLIELDQHIKKLQLEIQQQIATAATIEKYNEQLELKVQERTSQLQEQEAYLRSILDNSINAIITIDNHGLIDEFNPAAEKLFGFSKGEVMGELLADFIIPSQYRDAHNRGVANLVEKINPENPPPINRRFEVTGVRADGNLVDLEIELTTIIRSGAIYFVAFLDDITDRKQLLQSLRDTLATAESASRSKSEFLANMSHEIRSPMNAIMGMTELVLGSDLTEDQRENLTIVQYSSHTLLNLINDILDFSKIEAGQLSLEQIPFNICDLVDKTSKSMAVRAHQKDLELYCDIDQNIPTLLGDPLRINQVMTNLLSNAIKFTTSGEVVISTHIVPQKTVGNDRLTLHFSVADTGVGIPANRIKAVFEQFTQGDGSTTRNYGGTGLGLTISKRLVDLMGGNICVDSVVGYGSTFHFSAEFIISQSDKSQPGSRIYPANGQPPDDKYLDNIQVLLGDGNQNGQKIIKKILTSFGAKTTIAKDGKILMAAMQNGTTSDNGFDLILLDFALFNHGESARLPPTLDRKNSLIMVPSHLKSSDLESQLNIKNASLIKKPLNPPSLLQAIDKILGREVDEQIVEQDLFIKYHSSLPLTILLVDDMPNNQTLARTILERAGHAVIVAENGHKALKKLEVTEFDLILMDLHMPDMDGYETTRRIRSGKIAAPCNPQIPIIAVTALAISSEEEKCHAAKMNGYLSKPYRIAELLTVIAPFTKTLKAKPKKKNGPSKSPILVAVPATASHEYHASYREFISSGLKHYDLLKNGGKHKRPAAILKEAEWLYAAAAAIGANRIKVRTIRLKGVVEMKNWQRIIEIIDELEPEVAKAIRELKKKNQATSN